MTMDSLRAVGVIILEPIVNIFHMHRITANALSLLSLLFAMLAGVCYYFSMGSSLILFIALILVFLNALMDGADGLLARKTNSASKYGDFLDHVIDRYTDVFIIGGACLGGYVGRGHRHNSHDRHPAGKLPWDAGAGRWNWPQLRGHNGKGRPPGNPDPGNLA